MTRLPRIPEPPVVSALVWLRHGGAALIGLALIALGLR
jgi:hypothetical protein